MPKCSTQELARVAVRLTPRDTLVERRWCRRYRGSSDQQKPYLQTATSISAHARVLVAARIVTASRPLLSQCENIQTTPENETLARKSLLCHGSINEKCYTIGRRRRTTAGRHAFSAWYWLLILMIQCLLWRGASPKPSGPPTVRFVTSRQCQTNILGDDLPVEQLCYEPATVQAGSNVLMKKSRLRSPSRTEIYYEEAETSTDAVDSRAPMPVNRVPKITETAQCQTTKFESPITLLHDDYGHAGFTSPQRFHHHYSIEDPVSSRRLLSGPDGYIFYQASDSGLLPLQVHVRDIVFHSPFSTPLFPYVYFLGKREAIVESITTGNALRESTPIGRTRWVVRAVDIVNHLEKWRLEWSEVTPIISLGDASPDMTTTPTSSRYSLMGNSFIRPYCATVADEQKLSSANDMDKLSGSDGANLSKTVSADYRTTMLEGSTRSPIINSVQTSAVRSAPLHQAPGSQSSPIESGTSSVSLGEAEIFEFELSSLDTQLSSCKSNAFVHTTGYANPEPILQSTTSCLRSSEECLDEEPLNSITSTEAATNSLPLPTAPLTGRRRSFPLCISETETYATDLRDVPSYCSMSIESIHTSPRRWETERGCNAVSFTPAQTDTFQQSYSKVTRYPMPPHTSACSRPDFDLPELFLWQKKHALCGSFFVATVVCLIIAYNVVVVGSFFERVLFRAVAVSSNDDDLQQSDVRSIFEDDKSERTADSTCRSLEQRRMSWPLLATSGAAYPVYSKAPRSSPELSRGARVGAEPPFLSRITIVHFNHVGGTDTVSSVHTAALPLPQEICKTSPMSGDENNRVPPCPLSTGVFGHTRLRSLTEVPRCGLALTEVTFGQNLLCTSAKSFKCSVPITLSQGPVTHVLKRSLASGVNVQPQNSHRFNVFPMLPTEYQQLCMQHRRASLHSLHDASAELRYHRYHKKRSFSWAWTSRPKESRSPQAHPLLCCGGRCRPTKISQQFVDTQRCSSMSLLATLKLQREAATTPAPPLHTSANMLINPNGTPKITTVTDTAASVDRNEDTALCYPVPSSETRWCRPEDNDNCCSIMKTGELFAYTESPSSPVSSTSLTDGGLSSPTTTATYTYDHEPSHKQRYSALVGLQKTDQAEDKAVTQTAAAVEPAAGAAVVAAVERVLRPVSRSFHVMSSSATSLWDFPVAWSHHAALRDRLKRSSSSSSSSLNFSIAVAPSQSWNSVQAITPPANDSTIAASKTTVTSATSRIPAGSVLADFVENGRFYRTFEDIELIGEGSFGSVYRARHRFEPSSPQYAIKLVTLRLKASQNISHRRYFHEVSTNRDLFSRYVIRYFTWWCEEPQYLPSLLPMSKHVPPNGTALLSMQRERQGSATPLYKQDPQRIQKCQEEEERFPTVETSSLSSSSTSCSGQRVQNSKERSGNDPARHSNVFALQCRSNSSYSVRDNEKRLYRYRGHYRRFRRRKCHTTLRSRKRSWTYTNCHTTWCRQRRCWSQEIATLPKVIVKTQHRTKRLQLHYSDTLSESPRPRNPSSNGRQREERLPVTLLIQMELMEGMTLRQWLDRSEKSTEVHGLLTEFQQQRQQQQHPQGSPTSDDFSGAPLAGSKWRGCPAEISLFRQLMKGLRDIHMRGIVHRDIKPENVFVNAASLSLKIGDFGLARFIEARSIDPATTPDRLHRHPYRCDHTDRHHRKKGHRSTNEPQKKDRALCSGKRNVAGDATSTKSNSRESNDANKHSGNTIFRESQGGDAICVGTPLYAAPEGGTFCTEKADIFSAALILLELLCPRFNSPIKRFQVLEAFKKTQALPEHITTHLGGWGDLIRHMGAPLPHERPSADAVYHAIKVLSNSIVYESSSSTATSRSNASPQLPAFESVDVRPCQKCYL